MDPLAVSKALTREVGSMHFGAPVSHVYNPLEYAWKPHSLYLKRYGMGRKRVLFLGMNPGPYGMAQNGIPFGEMTLVRDWLRLEAPVGKPPREHPKRPISGFACTRSEVSGRRLWGWAKDRFKTPQRFFKNHMVLNYCPLVFMEASGRNLTPDKLAPDKRRPLMKACDKALRRFAEYYQPDWVIGVGGYAQKRASEALAGMDLKVGVMLHPSPASPAANRGWAPQAEAALKKLGIL